MKRYIIIASLALAALLSCERMPEQVEICGVGSRVKTIDVSWDGGDCTADILASGKFTVSIPKEADWIGFKGEQPSVRLIEKEGDGPVVFTLEVNRGIPRSVEIGLECGTSAASLLIRQDGLLEGGLQVEQKNVLAPYEGGRLSAKINTKIAASEFSFDAEYLESESTGWVSGIHMSGNYIVFDVEPNLADSLTRHADVIATYPGGIGKVHIVQYSAGTEVDPIDVKALKNLLTAKGSLVLDKHYIVSGIVLNDDTEGNGAENRMISADNPDPGYSSRIIYLQSEDGADGIKLIFEDSCADVASRYDRISFDAFGLTLTRESDPVRYEINDIPTSIVTESCRGEAPQAKVRSIAALSESDLYTLVKVENVQIPIRKGPYMPIDIRFINIVTAYPMTLKDNAGKSLYMMVNSDCVWSRDGNPMPQGSGSVTGVLVHETCDNFEWDTGKEATIKAQGVISNYITGLGNIGKWQLRPVFHSDIALADSLKDGFSKLLWEWSYCDSLGVNLAANYDGSLKVLRPTWPQVADPRTDTLTAKAALYCRNSDMVGNKGLELANDFTHLGPYTYGGEITKPENGNGMYDVNGRSTHWYVYASTNTTGVIYSQYLGTGEVNWGICNGSAWCCKGWSINQYWECEFSTADLDASNAPLSIQFGTFNHISYTGAPRYWSIDWSDDGDNWERLYTYSVPDFPATNTRKVWQLPGAKYVSVNLPTAALGLDKCYVRLVPSSPTGLAINSGIGNDSSYYVSSSFNSNRYNAINYFAVRCNK